MKADETLTPRGGKKMTAVGVTTVCTIFHFTCGLTAFNFQQILIKYNLFIHFRYRRLNSVSTPVSPVLFCISFSFIIVSFLIFYLKIHTSFLSAFLSSALQISTFYWQTHT